MTERKLSMLGHLMDRLGLSATTLVRRLYVDVSLVNKWRDNSRRFNARSVHFDEAHRMLLEQNPMTLTDALCSLIPLEEPKGEERERGKGGGRQPVRGGGDMGDKGYIRNWRIVGNRRATLPRAE